MDRHLEVRGKFGMEDGQADVVAAPPRSSNVQTAQERLQEVCPIPGKENKHFHVDPSYRGVGWEVGLLGGNQTSLFQIQHLRALRADEAKAGIRVPLV
jgi:hypothetical protein